MSQTPPPPPPPYGGEPTPPSYGSTPPPPPPPPGGYGTPPGGYGPPPGAPGGYGAPPSGWDAGSALSFGWKGFTGNVGPVLLAGLVALLLTGVVSVIGIVLSLAAPQSFVGQLPFIGLRTALTFLASSIVAAQFARAALPVADGQPFTLERFFDFSRLGPIIVASLLVSVVVLIGTALCILPGLIAAYLLSYTTYFVVDQHLEPVEALKASFNLCKDNLGPTLLWFVLGYVLVLVGVCLCGVGLIATLPISLFGTVYTYRTLTGRPPVVAA